MSILVNLKDTRSDLQKRIAAEMDEKTKGGGKKPVIKSKKVDLEPEGIDGVDDSEYIKGYEQSRVLSLDKTWLILIGGIILIILIIIILAIIG